jgi:sulfatase maturation enzyme AslB (radical SAM superfamily)
MSFICKAPWTSIAFHPTGVAPCCQYELEYVESFDLNNLFAEPRRQFLNGQIPPGCKKCHDTHKHHKDGYYSAFEQYDTNFIDTNIQEINVRANNLCNLSCRSCGPHFSSKWEEELHSIVIVTKNSNIYDHLEKINFSNLKMLVFAGGEPTMLPEHAKVLQHLVDIGHTQCSVRISTNCHNLKYKNVDLIKLWKSFPNLRLQISLDATQDRAESIRSGTNWTRVESTLTSVIENKIKFHVNITVSALNIWFLEETVNYLTNKFGEIPFTFYLLSNPDILSVDVIPEKYRYEIYNQIDRLIAQRNNMDLSKIKIFMQKNCSEHLWASFLLYTLMLDHTRKEKLFDQLPIKNQLVIDWTDLQSVITA